MQKGFEAEAGPRRRDPQATRQRIITAASAILVTEGSAALTHRAVAAKAGVAVGSTTRYFATIDDLRASALQSLSGDLATSLVQAEESLRGGADVAAVLTSILMDFLDDQHQVRASLALMSAAVDDPDLRQIAIGWADGLEAMLSQRVGLESAVALVMYLDGSTIHTALRETRPDATAIRTVVDAIINMAKES